MATIITPALVQGLSCGRPFAAELPARRPGLRRMLMIYPVGIDRLAPLGMPTRLSIVCCEAAPEVIAAGQQHRDSCADYDVIYLDDPDALEATILQLAGGPVMLQAIAPKRMVIRQEPGNWRIEYDGRLLASAANQDQARGFAYAAAQHHYEYNGFVPLITLIGAGPERSLPWQPDHDFLEIVED
ncbi:hypothetical protein [Devosia sp. FKR38]|uniref:hypothetical protein n=1 Tax=Devosia sp. FKR38 TaxID=2562312 RepID=UPI0010C00157|nr:hypothetical protein [Devosia sp. FKR38]